MHLTPYLLFDGRCDEALDFYRRTLGAEVTVLMRMKDNPDAAKHNLPDSVANKVMHCEFRIGDTKVFATDGGTQGMTTFTGQPKFDGFQLALTVASDAEVAQRFQALGEGGQVVQPLTKTFFSSSFGMLIDRFGVRWVLLVG